MAIQSGFFNSIGGDRVYDAKRFAEYFATFIGNGVFPNPSTGLQVLQGNNLTTVVRAGKGWINGYYVVNDSDYTLQHDVADGVLNRIDRIAVRLDYGTRDITIYLKKGTFSSTPAPPALQRDSEAYELSLADVYIQNGAVQISQSNITDNRLNNNLCGIVQGTVNQVSTTTIFNQYQAWFDSVKNTSDAQVSDLINEQRQAFDQFFESIQDTLNGDVAANLAQRIEALTNRVNGIENTLDNHVNNNSHVFWLGQSSGTNAITLSSDKVTSYVDGLGLSFKAANDTTDNATLKINSLNAIPIKYSDGKDAKKLKANGIYTVRYSAGNFILQGEGGGSVVSDLNIFTQLEEPEGKNGIWIKSQVENTGVVLDDELYFEGKFLPDNSDLFLSNFAQSRATAQVYKGEIYLFGSTVNPRRVSKYNPETKTFTQLDTLPIDMAYSGSALVGDEVYILGGNVAASYNVLVVYNLETNQMSQYSINVSGYTNRYPIGFTFEDEPHFYGRYQGENSINSVIKIDKETKEVSVVANGISAFSRNQNSTATLVGTKLYIFGLNSNGMGSFRYNLESSPVTYTSLPNSPIDLRESKSVAVGTKVYLFGGYASNVAANRTMAYVFDTVERTYTQIDDMPRPRFAHNAVLLQDRIYLIGNDDSYSTSLFPYRYDVYTLTSKQFEEGSVVVQRSSENLGLYYTELISTDQQVIGNRFTLFKTGYDSAYQFYGGKLRTLETYNGTGSQWVKIKDEE